jgi:hypothetical protein
VSCTVSLFLSCKKVSSETLIMMRQA